jgi:hypothetical protein
MSSIWSYHPKQAVSEVGTRPERKAIVLSSLNHDAKHSSASGFVVPLFVTGISTVADHRPSLQNHNTAVQVSEMPNDCVDVIEVRPLIVQGIIDRRWYSQPAERSIGSTDQFLNEHSFIESNRAPTAKTTVFPIELDKPATILSTEIAPSELVSPNQKSLEIEARESQDPLSAQQLQQIEDQITRLSSSILASQGQHFHQQSIEQEVVKKQLSQLQEQVLNISSSLSFPQTTSTSTLSQHQIFSESYDDHRTRQCLSHSQPSASSAPTAPVTVAVDGASHSSPTSAPRKTAPLTDTLPARPKPTPPTAVSATHNIKADNQSQIHVEAASLEKFARIEFDSQVQPQSQSAQLSYTSNELCHPTMQRAKHARHRKAMTFRRFSDKPRPTLVCIYY